MAPRPTASAPPIRHRFARVPGAQAHLLETGAGPPLVLLSSPLVLARTYHPTLRALAGTFLTRVVELPGSGRSARVQRPWANGAYADWTARLLDALGLERALLAGHSNSGAVALECAARHPDRVAGLVLVDTVGARRARSLPRVVATRALDAVLEPGLSATAWSHVLFNLVRHPRNLLHQVRFAADAWLLDRATHVPVPTLLAWGRNDHTMPLDCAERLRDALPRARLHIGPGSHDWLITHAASFADAVRAFARDLAR